MPRTKTQKKEIIEKVRKIADESKTIVFVNFHGIKVADATKIRRKLKSENIGLFVAKKSLMGKAFEGSKATGTMPVTRRGSGFGVMELILSRQLARYMLFKKNTKTLSKIYRRSF